LKLVDFGAIGEQADKQQCCTVASLCVADCIPLTCFGCERIKLGSSLPPPCDALGTKCRIGDFHSRVTCPPVIDDLLYSTIKIRTELFRLASAGRLTSVCVNTEPDTEYE